MKIENFKTFLGEEDLTEGVNDPSIFKAIFMAGGPGSGKSFIASKSAFNALGLKTVNSDDAYEFAMKKAGLSLDPDTIATERGQALRDKAKTQTSRKQKRYLMGRLGLAIDGTGHNLEKIKRQKQELEKLGYETAMVFVNTDLKTAFKRNKERPRSVPERIVGQRWHDVQKNLGGFQQIFGRHMYIIDNNEGSDININSTVLYKKIQRWVKSSPANPVAQRWIKSQTT